MANTLKPLRKLPKGSGLRCQSRCLSSTAHLRAGEVRIVEVGPRDGLQNEKKAISLQSKLELIRRLSQTGVRDIEAGSFVAPKWVPQMANSAEVLHSLKDRPPTAPGPITYNFLVPNFKGLENFLKARDIEKTEDAESIASRQNSPNVFPTPPPSPSPSNEPASITSTQDPNAMPASTPKANDSVPSDSTSTGPHKMEISLFTAATEAFSKANTNCTIAESLQRCEPIVSLAKSKDIRVRGYVSVALGCPYEGPEVDPNRVAEITRTLLAMGADEVSVADTTGMGTAPKTQELMKALLGAGISVDDLALHFHDTYGQALVNILVGLENGVRTFDSSVGGLGGCPYSKGATGNVATEDLIHCLHSLGMQTGVSLAKMAEIGAWVSAELERPNDSRAGKAVLARIES